MAKPRVDTALQRRMEAAAREIGHNIKAALPDNVGFVLLIAAHGDQPETTYISTLEREDCVELLREMADVLERQLDVPPGRPQ